MATTISQERLDQAVDALKRKPMTNQELADALQCTYQYASMIMAALKRYKLVTLHSTEGRQHRYTVNEQLFTIPAFADQPTVPAIKHWLKLECNAVTRTATMFNSHVMWALVNLLKCIRTYDRQTHEEARRNLLRYREQLTNLITVIDATLNNNAWWDKELLGKLANDPNCPTTDEINSWVAYAKAKLAEN